MGELFFGVLSSAGICIKCHRPDAERKGHPVCSMPSLVSHIVKVRDLAVMLISVHTQTLSLKCSKLHFSISLLLLSPGMDRTEEIHHSYLHNFCLHGPPHMLCRPCVDCGLFTGNFCDGTIVHGWEVVCEASHRLPKERWVPGQRTPLCTNCERRKRMCRYCRMEPWVTPPPHGPRYEADVADVD